MSVPRSVWWWSATLMQGGAGSFSEKVTCHSLQKDTESSRQTGIGKIWDPNEALQPLLITFSDIFFDFWSDSISAQCYEDSPCSQSIHGAMVLVAGQKTCITDADICCPVNNIQVRYEVTSMKNLIEHQLTSIFNIP